MFGRGAGRSINSGTSACPMFAHDQTCYNFLEDFLWVAAPSQSQFWSYVNHWLGIPCLAVTQKWSTLSVCAFLQGILWYYHTFCIVLYNLTSFEANTVEIPHLLHFFEAKTVVSPRFLQSFKAKAVVSPHSLHFPHSLKPKLWYVFMSCIITTRFAQSET